MEAIRTKDKLFVAIVIPIVAAATYVGFWRMDAARRVGALTNEKASLVAAEDFPSERAQAERQRASARAALEAEKKTPMPAARVKAQASDSVAARELAVLEIFRQAGLVVISGKTADAKESRGGDVLKATGTCPAPVCRTYGLVGRYPDLLGALRTISRREMAVIPDGIAMPESNHWILTLWL